MNTVRPSTIPGDAAGELVDEFHSLAADDVVDVAPEQMMGVERYIHRGIVREPRLSLDTGAAESLLNLVLSGHGQDAHAPGSVDGEVLLRTE